MDHVRLPFITLLFLLVLACRPVPSYAAYRDGDIIFQRSESRQCEAVAAATGSIYTHVGLIFYEEAGPMVYEAVQPVKKTPLRDWIRKGREGHFVVKRLAEGERVLPEAKTVLLRKVAAGFLGKDYDPAFAWSDERIYCSELVWKAYDRALGIRLGVLKKLGDFDLGSPVVKKLLRERYGKNVPYRETVISPKDLFESVRLREVGRG